MEIKFHKNKKNWEDALICYSAGVKESFRKTSQPFLMTLYITVGIRPNSIILFRKLNDWGFVWNRKKKRFFRIFVIPIVSQEKRNLFSWKGENLNDFCVYSDLKKKIERRKKKQFFSGQIWKIIIPFSDSKANVFIESVLWFCGAKIK